MGLLDVHPRFWRVGVPIGVLNERRDAASVAPNGRCSPKSTDLADLLLVAPGPAEPRPSLPRSSWRLACYGGTRNLALGASGSNPRRDPRPPSVIFPTPTALVP